MRKITVRIAAAAAAMLTAMSAQALETSVKPAVTDLGVTPESYMLVGNSFTYYSCGLNTIVNGLAKADGRKIRRNRMVTIGAADLEWFNVWDLVRPTGIASTYVDHADGGKIKRFDFTKEKVFDVVVLQDNSKGPIDPMRRDTFRRGLERHSTDLAAIGIRSMIMMTWAWEGRPGMTRELADATTTAANDNGVMVIPAGLAFAEALKARPELKLYRPDHFHPSAEGSYLAGCVLYATMYRKSPEGLAYYGAEPVDPKTTAFLQKTAWETTSEFFGWAR